MKKPICLLLTLLLAFAFVPAYASLPATGTVKVSPEQPAAWPLRQQKIKKPGPIGKWLANRTLKRFRPGRALAGEKASKRARLALILFVASVALGNLASLIPFFAVLFGMGWLISIILSIIVLSTEDNPASRKIAFWILLLSGIMIVLSLILLWILISFFNAM